MPSQIRFSPDGVYFAVVTGTGQLRIWDVKHNDVKVERAAELDDPIVSIAWENGDRSDLKSAKKRKKRLQAQRCEQLACGTRAGRVFILAVATGEVRALDGRHKSKVSSLAWSMSNKLLFSASTDKHVIAHNTEDATSEHSFVGDKRGVTCVEASKSSSHIITAGAQVRVWDEGYQEVKKLPGHSSPVSSLLCLPCPKFLVASHVFLNNDDTVVNVWQCDGKTDASAKKPFAAFDAEDGVSAIDAALVTGKLQGHDCRVLALTGKGELRVFALSTTSEPSATPVTSATHISLATGDVSSEIVPILAAQFEGNASKVLIAQGSELSPVFETLEIVGDNRTLIANINLVRDAPVNLITSLGSGANEDKAAQKALNKKNGNIVVMSAADTTSLGSNGIKTKDSERTLGERLAEIDASAKDTKDFEGYTRAGIPRSGTLSSMLAQALQSQDEALLEECLSVGSETIIKSSVVRLEAKDVVKFFRIIVQKFESKPTKGLSLLVWIRAILAAHFTFLATVPELEELLKPLYGLIEARLTAYPRLCRLNGRLDILLAQTQRSNDLEPEVDFHPSFVLHDDGDQDESEDEAIEEDDADDDIVEEDLMDDEEDEDFAAIDVGADNFGEIEDEDEAQDDAESDDDEEEEDA